MTAGTLALFPLGGLGEIGMNCFALEQRGQILLVDCGVTFDDRGIGVDVIHPSFAALEQYEADGARIVGVVVTHGHEDHIGALPYLLRRFDCPVYAPPYALGLIRERLGEHEILQYARLNEVRVRTPFAVGSFLVEPIRVTHSIADATAVAIRTDAGMVIHSGDFKIDPHPEDGETFDADRLRELGDEGVALLLSDSTNVDSIGTTGSEEIVHEALEAIVENAKGAVVVGVFASNVHRLRMLGEIALKTGRKLVLLGRSVQTHSRVAHATGYLGWPTGLVHPAERARELPPARILGIATGTQAEERAALGRLARGDHHAMSIGAGDTVVMSSRIIPGHEPEVYELMGNLLRLGVELITRGTDKRVHVSGHAHQDEQRKMIELVRPRSFVPLHGTLHHLRKHAEIARSYGADARVIENGQRLRLSELGLEENGRVESGRVHRFAGHEIAPSVLRERGQLAETGIAFAAVPVTARGELSGEIVIETRGIVDAETAIELVARAKNEAARAIADVQMVKSIHDGGTTRDDASIVAAVRSAIRRTFFQATGSKCVCIVVVQREAKS